MIKRQIVEESGISQREITRRAARGIAALGSRQILVLATNLLGSVFLARFFSHSELGLLAVFTLLLAFATVLSDVGLNGALIRKTATPTQQDLSLAFTVQLALGISVFIVTWASAPALCNGYRLNPEAALDFRIVSICGLLLPLSSVAQVKLERTLNFGVVAKIEVTQTIIYNGSAAILGYFEFGAHALSGAILLRTVTGCLLLNVAVPWRPSLAWNTTAILEYLRFGLPYQASRWLSFLKDTVNPILVGLTLNLSSVGQLSWAQSVAAYPVMALAVLRRLYLPAFSKLQEDPPALRKMVETTLWLTASIVAPLSTTLLALIHPITGIVYGEKWTPAIPYFLLFWSANIFAAISAPLISLLEASGEAKKAFSMSAIWLCTTWALTPPFIEGLGATGLPLANLFVQLTNLHVFRYCSKKWSINIKSSVATPWLVAGSTACAVYTLNILVPASGPIHLATYIISSFCINFLASAVIEKKRWMDLLHDLKREK